MNTAAASNFLLFTPDLDSSRFTNDDGSYSALIEIQEGQIMKMTLSGVMNLSDQQETDKLISTMFSYYQEAGFSPPFYVLADVSKLVSIHSDARIAAKKSLQGFFRKGNIDSIVVVAPNYILRTLLNLVKRLQPSLTLSTSKSLDEAYQKINAQKKKESLANWSKNQVNPDKISKVKPSETPLMEYSSISKDNSGGQFFQTFLTGIRKIINRRKNQGPPQVPNIPDRKQLDLHSREELYQMLIEARKENEEIKNHQTQRIDELFQMISSISWDKDYVPEKFDNRENDDPFYDLMDAAAMLQQDIGSITRELKTHNSTLEEDVQIRTRELARKEANLSALVENTSDIILSANSDLEILVSNSAARKISGMVYGMPFDPGVNVSEVLNQDQLAIWQPMLDRVFSGHVFKKVASIVLCNEERFFEYSFNPIWEEDGVISGFSFFGKDITQKEVAEQEVRKQQQLLTSINKSIKEGIFRSAPGNKIVYVNEAFAKMFGYESVEEVLALDPDALYINPSRREDFHNLMQGKNNFFTNQEVQFRRKDGSKFWGLMSSIKAIDEKGNVYFDGAIRDVTEIREHERQIKEQNQKLIKVNRELDQFVYCTSHDLRAPLVSMKGLINIAQQEEEETTRNYYFDLMLNSINKLDGFIKDIMGYSKNARSVLKREKIEFHGLLEDTIHGLKFAPEIEKIASSIEVDIKGSFYSDPTRLEMIFNNMISNAFRYSDPDKENPFVKVTVKGNSDRVEIAICDNGIGIEEKSIAKIFNMFYRGTKKSEGSGIGLYIVKEAVERIGGRISVDSRAGEGTCFTIDLPAIPADSPDIE